MNIFEIFNNKPATKSRAKSSRPVVENIGPDKNDPYEKGWRAGFHHTESNPYPAGSKEAKQWDNGYAEAEAQPNHYDEGVAEGYAGADDTDTVGFSVNTEAAYNAVMQRFGDAIDHDETSGIMYAPARVWPQIEMVAFDADGEGAIRDEDMSEATGDKPFDSMMKTISQGTKKQAATDKKDQKVQSQQQARDAFGGMFGGGNPVSNLKIREQGVAEGEGMSRAAKGHEKYGKEGMQALAKAGRDGASEKKLDTIRDKHDKYNTKVSEAKSDQSEMERPEVQSAIARMKKRHENEPWSLEKSQALGKKLAARSADKKKTENSNLPVAVDSTSPIHGIGEEQDWHDGKGAWHSPEDSSQDAWHDGRGQWSDGRGQWSESADKEMAEYLAEMKSAGYDIK